MQDTPPLTLRGQLVAVATAFAEAKNAKSLKRLSTLMFNDSGRLDKLREETGDITTINFEKGMEWLSGNFPENAVWPENVPRPYAPKPVMTEVSGFLPDFSTTTSTEG